VELHDAVEEEASLASSHPIAMAAAVRVPIAQKVETVKTGAAAWDRIHA
jgi:hypothetical protein